MTCARCTRRYPGALAGGDVCGACTQFALDVAALEKAGTFVCPACRLTWYVDARRGSVCYACDAQRVLAAVRAPAIS